MIIMANIKMFHPGIYVKDAIDTLGMSSKEFSFRTGISERTLSSIITCKGRLTFDVAYKLSSFFDNSVDFWLNLDNNYSLYLKKEEERRYLEEDWNLLKEIKDYLIDNNFLDSMLNKEQSVKEIRKLLGVNRLTLLNKKDLIICFKEQRTNKETNFFYQNCFTSLALNKAREEKAPSYNRRKLQKGINAIKKLTTLPLKEALTLLKNILLDCGVIFVYLPYMPKSNIYGVTKWLNKDKVMVAISNKSNEINEFWFTVFHEIAHVLMEHKREAFITFDDSLDLEANKMAEDMLNSID